MTEPEAINAVSVVTPTAIVPKLASLSRMQRLAMLPRSERDRVLAELTEKYGTDGILFNWKLWARPEQRWPPGQWIIWNCICGRGWGKTKTGAETVREYAETHPRARIALMGRTAADVRDVMIDGDSGILACCPPDRRPLWQPSMRRLVWPNGAKAIAYSADEPGQLRGPQHHFGWGDELAAWDNRDAWDNFLMGLRLGDDPRCIVTTTPRPSVLMREIIADPDAFTVNGTTYDNASNLAPTFIAKMRKKYDGTRLGKQELEGLMLDDVQGALWNWKMIDKARLPTGVPAPTEFERLVVAIDPAVSANANSDETGIVVVGKIGERFYVIADLSGIYTAAAWAKEAVGYYRAHKADRIVGEVNNGGDLVERNVMIEGDDINFKQVRASRGKSKRAEPVAALYEQGRVTHCEIHGQLENQMCSWSPYDKLAKSPDRMDALVWGISELMDPDEPEARIRIIG